jgi:hypothetical protein
MWFVNDAFWRMVPVKLENLKFEYENKEIVIKHNFNNTCAIVLNFLHNLNPLIRH